MGNILDVILQAVKKIRPNKMPHDDASVESMSASTREKASPRRLAAGAQQARKASSGKRTFGLENVDVVTLGASRPRLIAWDRQP